MKAPYVDKVIALDDMMLKIKFVDGTVKYYDGHCLFELDPQPIYDGHPMFEPLEDNPELFSRVYVSYGGECIAWNNEIDIPGSILWHNGITTTAPWTSEDDAKVNEKPFDAYGLPRQPKLNESEIAFFDELSIKIFPTNDSTVTPYITATSESGNTRNIGIARGEVIDDDEPFWIDIVREWLDKHRDEVQDIWNTGKLRAVSE